MPGGRPGRRGPVERPPGRWAQRAAEALAKGHERTRASRARRPRPFTNRSEISPTARPGVGGHEGLPGMPSGRSWPARAEKISKSALTGALWRSGTVEVVLSEDQQAIFEQFHSEVEGHFGRDSLVGPVNSTWQFQLDGHPVTVLCDHNHMLQLAKAQAPKVREMEAHITRSLLLMCSTANVKWQTVWAGYICENRPTY